VDEALKKASWYPKSGDASTFADMRGFIELYANEVDRVISEVRTNLPLQISFAT
jgi:hypothetical protein